jgi:putative hydrolase of the HAD superfamily
MIKAVWFDLDNTLIDWFAAQRLYCAAFVATHFPGLEEAERRERAETMVTLGGDGNDVSLAEFFRRIQERWPLPMSAQALLAERTRLFCGYTTPFADVYETLDRLKERYRLGILTNGEEKTQRRKIAVARLEPYFETIVPSGATPYRKPDAALFAHCLALMGIEPNEAVMVGDSVPNDVRGALGAGWNAIRVRVPDYPAETIPGVPEIDRLAELPRLLCTTTTEGTEVPSVGWRRK